jgi:hypothetical protein
MKALARMLSVASIATAAVLLASCATPQRRTDPYVFTDPARLEQPFTAWLRTVEIVSNNIPLSRDYALVSDSLVATASRYGVLLSTARTGQPYAVDLVIHEHTYTLDLASVSSIMAILNVSDDAGAAVARVVHSAVLPDSIVSLHLVAQIDETLFAALRKTVDQEARTARETAKRTPQASR